MSPWHLYGWIAPGTMKAPLKRIKHFAKEKKNGYCNNSTRALITINGLKDLNVLRHQHQSKVLLCNDG